MFYYRKFITDVTKIKVSHCEFKLVKFDDADEEYSIPDKDIKRTDVQELIEIINVLVDAKPKVNLKNGDLVYLVITVDNRKPADNEQYLLYRQPEEGIAKAKFLDIDELRELVIGANN